MGIDKIIKVLFDILFTGKRKILKEKFLSIVFDLVLEMLVPNLL